MEPLPMEPLPIEPLVDPVDAEIVLPGSKSITNRALVCAAHAPGESKLSGVLFSDDTEAMLGCLADLGVGLGIDRQARTVEVAGGVEGVDGAVLDARMSGTTARFVAPMAAASARTVVLDGAPQLRARPMGDLWASLSELGSVVEELGSPGHLPVHLETPGRQTKAVVVPGNVSSQFLSGLLLSAPVMPRGIEVTVEGPLVSVPYVAMTISVMQAFGADVEHSDDYHTIRVAPRSYEPGEYHVEPDASAASYFLAATAAHGGRIRLPGLGRNSIQGDTTFAGVLERMGAEVEFDDSAVELRSEGHLHGISVNMEDISDTAQTLAAIAPFADGPVSVDGIDFIRGKETDRIAAVVTELRRLGIDAVEDVDGFTVQPGEPIPAVVETYDDHRMAMSFAVLGLMRPGISIADPGCVSKTFPDFWQTLELLGRPAP